MDYDTMQIPTCEAAVEEALFYRESGNVLYIRAQGHIAVKLCAELKARVFERLEANPPVQRLYVDLGPCEYMDSTFMGLLVGFNKRLLRFSEKPITILRANETCQKLLRTIGITRLVELSDEAVPFPELEPIGSAGAAPAGMLLDAHEDLAGLSEENEKKFAGLLSILEQKARDEKAD